MPDPFLPEEIEFGMLDRDVRRALRGLTKENAEVVGRHLVMAGRLVDVDPELAYEHAQAAGRRAARIDVVREALAITAYASGRYAETLREIRTARRLSGSDSHRVLEADAERGLGRPERALAVVREALEHATLAERIELTLVAAGARLDLDEAEVALLLLDELPVPARLPELAERVQEAREPILRALGRAAEADAVAAAVPTPELPDEEVLVFDLEEDVEPVSDSETAAAPGASEPEEPVVPEEPVESDESVEPEPEPESVEPEPESEEAAAPEPESVEPEPESEEAAAPELDVEVHSEEPVTPEREDPDPKDAAEQTAAEEPVTPERENPDPKDAAEQTAAEQPPADPFDPDEEGRLF